MFDFAITGKQLVAGALILGLLAFAGFMYVAWRVMFVLRRMDDFEREIRPEWRSSKQSKRKGGKR